MLEFFYSTPILFFWLLGIIPYFIVFIFVLLFKTIGDFEDLSKKYADNKAFMQAVLIVWIFGFIGSYIIDKHGSENLNSFWVKRNFKFSGYVYAFPDNKHDKNYRLRADMEKFLNRYCVSRIYFYNGGYIDFDTDEYEYVLDDKGSMSCSYSKNDDEEWCFRFYGEQIKNKNE